MAMGKEFKKSPELVKYERTTTGRRVVRRIKNQRTFVVDGLTYWVESIPRKPPWEVGTACIRPAMWPDEDDDVIFEALIALMRGWS